MVERNRSVTMVLPIVARLRNWVKVDFTIPPPPFTGVQTLLLKVTTSTLHQKWYKPGLYIITLLLSPPFNIK